MSSKPCCAAARVTLGLIVLGTVFGQVAPTSGYVTADGGANPQPTPSPSPQPVADSGRPECKIEQGRRRPGLTINDVGSVVSNTPEECCFKCQDDPECESWTRDRRSGNCFLKSGVPAMAQGSNFDSGVIGGEAAPEQIPADTPCIVEQDTAFVDEGSSISSGGGISQSPEECCALCKLNFLCFSWNYDGQSRVCTLLSNIPARIPRDNHQCGTIL